MIVLDPGHHYFLNILDDIELKTASLTNINTLTFVKREGARYPGNKDSYPGTTSQEVIRCLIDRAKYVNNQIPCPETEAAIGLLQTVLLLFESRAKRVKNSQLDFNTIVEMENSSTCKKCGHVQCKEHLENSYEIR